MIEVAETAGLVYVSDALPGIARRCEGEDFTYWNPDGRQVTDPEELDRIHKLAIPPAYRDVWICADPDGHLQATGFDARGRKQYRYHPRFREHEDQNKFARLAEFGRALPELRRRVAEDLSAPGFPKRKVLAVVVYLLEHSLIRVGNEEYARTNKSYGLTTLRTNHVKVNGPNVEFDFVGKSRIRHRIQIHDGRLARVIKKIQDLPGQELFHYVDEEGNACPISSADVNAYLRETMGEGFTAKDFRTWWGTLLALVELAGMDVPASDAAAKRAVSAVMKAVSHRLGNTPAVCRKGYVHPLVVDSFRRGLLRNRFSAESESEDAVADAESALLDLLSA